MTPARFIIVGSGWRAAFYVRIAQALPDRFTLCAMLCRTQEKADRLASELGIRTTTAIEACSACKPDFVVVAVNKAAIAAVSRAWLERGFTVLCETPAALDMPTLSELWLLHQRGAKLVVAEQYRWYPTYRALISCVKSGLIGEAHCVNLSLAHDYHAASLMRALLQIPSETACTVQAKTYDFPTTETLTRYERYTDGRIALKKRTVATFAFANGKVCLYDFDSEQYRSPIRKNTVRVQGVRGEIIDNTVYFLDDQNEPQTKQILPEPCLAGLSEDETAIATLMTRTADYAGGIADEPYPLRDALQDAYLAILLQTAAAEQTVIASAPMPWHD